jgi:HEAT repeat protein
MLGMDTPAVERAIVQTLGAIGVADEPLLRRLGERLVQSDGPSDREFAAQSIGRIVLEQERPLVATRKWIRIIMPYLSAALDDRSVDVKSKLCELLDGIGVHASEEAIPLLKKLLTDDDKGIRRAAERVLRRIEGRLKSVGPLSRCEPTTHRGATEVAHPPPHDFHECRPEPTSATWRSGG